MKLNVINGNLNNEELGTDGVIVTPPFSPTDTGPPLGPAVLRGYAKKYGFDLRCLDLNIRYLNEFRDNSKFTSEIIGDQDKDYETNDKARRHFRESLCLEISNDTLADGVDEILGLQCSFDEIENALNAMEGDGFWLGFLNRHLFSTIEQPKVLGISIMGPAQVMIALLIARMSRIIWPNTSIILGGSHITLLSERIESDYRYGFDIDAFLPGHSEHTLVELMKVEPPYYEIPGVLIAGKTFYPTCPLPPEQWEPPSFEHSELSLYPIERLTLPIQLRRGCSYGKCTYCTYPKVEELTRNDVAEMARKLLPELLEHSPTRISVKDSLLDLKAMIDFGGVINELAPKVKWSCTTKLVPGMKKDKLVLLYQYGLRTIEFGIESIHESTQSLFSKRQPVDKVNRVVNDACDAGIFVVLNLIYGAPGETYNDAVNQLEWFLEMSEKWPTLIGGSHNMLEINYGSPLAEWENVDTILTGPWAFSLAWDAPLWRAVFSQELGRIGYISSTGNLIEDENTSNLDREIYDNLQPFG